MIKEAKYWLHVIVEQNECTVCTCFSTCYLANQESISFLFSLILELYSLILYSGTVPSRYCPFLTFPFEFFLKVFKTCLLGRGFHTLIKNVSFSSPTDVGSHNPLPFGAQRPCWHTTSCPPPFRAQPPRWHIAQCLALIPFVIAQAHR